MGKPVQEDTDANVKNVKTTVSILLLCLRGVY